MTSLLIGIFILIGTYQTRKFQLAGMPILAVVYSTFLAGFAASVVFQWPSFVKLILVTGAVSLLFLGVINISIYKNKAPQ